MLFGLAPAIAPVIGGWLQSAYGWGSVFVFLAGYTGLLLAWCCVALPETLPRAARQPVAPRPPTPKYLELLGSFRFGRLSSAHGFNFGGLFLYISSAPVIIYNWLNLNENQFAWLFVPAIGGFIFGAFLSGRMAGKLVPRRTVQIGYIVMFAAAVTAIAYHVV